MLDGIHLYTITGMDWTDGAYNLGKKLDMSSTEILAIMEGDAPDVWDSKEEKWVKARSGGDVEPYPWE